MTVTVTITTTEEISGLQALGWMWAGPTPKPYTLTGHSGVYTGTFVFDRSASAQEGYIWIWGTAADDQTIPNGDELCHGRGAWIARMGLP